MARMTEEQLRALAPIDKLKFVRDVIQDYSFDENQGDWTERAETVLWIVSDGAAGKNWGFSYEEKKSCE